jgi:hypothetical protein
MSQRDCKECEMLRKELTAVRANRDQLRIVAQQGRLRIAALESAIIRGDDVIKALGADAQEAQHGLE